jgi:transposase InsO family protein
MDITWADWSGMTYVCFIVAVFSRASVGWHVASSMRS